MFTKNIKVIACSALILGSSLFLLMIIFGVSGVNAASGSDSETTDTTSVVVENSYTLCHDGMDNDNNGTTDMGDRNCSNFTTAPATTTDTTSLVVENSYSLCHDGMDNDNNGTTDMGDRNCSNFVSIATPELDTTSVVVENSYTLCHDGMDNDNNGTTDMGDRNCAGHDTRPATTTPQNPVIISTGGGSSSSGSYLPGFGGLSTGSVLGAAIDTESTSTSCDSLFKTFMRKGYKNNKAEVIKLQKFLNTELNIKLPVTGTFGSLTDKAVREFQLKKANIVLVPWVKAGLMKNITSTGYFYRTTQFAANQILCPSTVVDAPILK